MLLIKNANLDGTGKIVDILIGDDGKYKEIAGHIEAPAGVETIDATGMMACPTFVNTHMHFDKAYTSYEQGRARATGSLLPKKPWKTPSMSCTTVSASILLRP